MSKKNAIVIGGGPLGLSVTFHLLLKKYQVTIIDSNKKIGGLAIPFDFKNDLIECYYHFFYYKDSKSSQDFLNKNKIKHDIIWSEISTDTFQNGKFINFDSIFSIFKISGIDFWKPFFTLITLKLFKPSSKLDKLTAKLWSEKKFGKSFCKHIWFPLLKNKFDKNWENISALWLATRIKRHLSTKVLPSGKSKFGYLVGTYLPLFQKINEDIIKNKGAIFTDEAVQEFIIDENKIKNIITTKRDIKISDNTVIFSTIPLLNLKKIIPLQNKLTYLNVFHGVGAIIVILKLKNKLSDAYWTTVTDEKIEFDALIQQNRLYSNYSNEIVYLSRYYSSDNKIFQIPDNKLLDIYLKGIKMMFPKFDNKQLLEYKIFKAKTAAPIPFVNTQKYLPRFKSSIENFYHAGYEHIYPEDRGVGNSFEVGKKMFDEFNQS